MLKLCLILIIILTTASCAPTQQQHKIRVPAFDLIIMSGEFKCGDVTTTGCITRTVELRCGKIATLYEIKVTGWEDDGKIYPHPGELAHELKHLLHREDRVFAEPYHRR